MTPAATTGQDGTRTVRAAAVRGLRSGGPALVAALLTGVAGTALGRRRTDRAPLPQASAPTDWPVVFAHRGGAEVAPENTLEAFREAEALGNVVLECDVHACADGTAVLMHDRTVNRTTDGSGRVVRQSTADLQRLDAGHGFTPDGRTFPWRGRGVRVPTLAELYETCPDCPVAIELKADHRGSARAVWRAIEAAGAQGRTLVAANDTTTIRRFRAASGGTVPTAAAIWEFAGFVLLAALGLHLCCRLPYQGLQPPDTFLGLRILTPWLVERAHEAGLRVDVWTIDDEADMRRLLAWGVDGIMTDRPDLLAGVLREG